MKIIGHRGAAGLALENTLQSIRVAQTIGVDAIEFDVRLTKDMQLALCHDAHLKRMTSARSRIRVRDHTIASLRTHTLRNGEQLASLDDALDTAATTPVFIEAKGDDWAQSLAALLTQRSVSDVTVIAINHVELAKFHMLLPAIPTYVVQRFSESDLLSTIRNAKRQRFTGIDLNFWLLNPLTYWLAKRAGLHIVVYTVNFVAIARMFARLYPDVAITTDRPDKFQSLRTKPPQRRKHKQKRLPQS